MKKRTKQPAPVPVTLDEFRAFIGPLADDYTDGQLRELQKDMLAMAQILLEHYLEVTQKDYRPDIQF